MTRPRFNRILLKLSGDTRRRGSCGAARLAAGLELAPQVGDEDVDGVRRRERVVAPDLLEQALARDDEALVAHQVLEQLELALGQLDRALAAA